MEITRIVKRKNIIVFVTLLLAEFAVFGVNCHQSLDMSSDCTEQEYSERIETIIQNAEDYSKVAIFQKEGTFSYRNLCKTERDYLLLRETHITSVNGTAWNSVLSSSVPRWFFLIYVVILVYLYMEKNLAIKQIVYTTGRGRGTRNLRVAGALVFWSFFIVVAVTFGNCLVVAALRGENIFGDLFATIQSVPRYSYCVFPISIVEYLVLQIFFNGMVCSLLALLSWLIFLCVEHVLLGLVFMGTFSVFEYIAAVKILPNSNFRFLAVVNLYSLWNSDDILREYENLNICNRAIGKISVVLITAGILLLIILSASFAYGQLVHPKEVKSFNLIADGFVKRFYRVSSENGFEIYKLFWGQRGWIAILIVVLFIWNSVNFTDVVRPKYQKMYYKFIDEWGGTPSEGAQAELEQLHTLLEELDSDFEKKILLYEEGVIDDAAYFAASFEYESYQSERIFYRIISEQREYLQKVEEEHGIQGWYVNWLASEKLFRKQKELVTILIPLLGGLLALASLLQEMQNNMTYLLNSTRKGRKMLWRRKFFLVMFCLLVVYSFYAVVDYLAVYKVYGISKLGAPIQSLEAFFEFPYEITILEYLIYRHVICFVIVVVVVAAVFLICKRVFMKKNGGIVWN